MSARDLVIRRVAGRARRFPHLDPEPMDTSVLAGEHARDAALALAIDREIARRWLTLRAVLRARIDRAWSSLDPDVQAVLLVGAAQLLFMDRVPDHAAINESVESMKRSAQPKAAGLVNAVLRRVAALRGEVVDTHDPDRRDEIPLSAGGAMRLREEILDVDRVGRLIEQTSHGRPLVEHWLREQGFVETRRLARHGLVQAPVIITGPPSCPASCAPHDIEGFYVLPSGRAELEAVLAEAPSARVQDPAAAAAVLATADLAPSVVVDVCAGKGTKTRQLRAVHPTAEIVATDVDPERLAVLRTACAELEGVHVAKPEELGRWRGAADLVVLDVPCSNTGVLARRVEAKYRFEDRAQRSLIDLQRSIARTAAPLRGPGGRLLYATCSIERAENDQQAAAIADELGLAVERSEAWSPRGLPGEPETSYTDGGFFALLGPAEPGRAGS